MGNCHASSYVYIGVALLASNCSLTKVVVYHIPWYGTVALVSSSTYVYMGLSVSCRNFHALQLPYNAVSSPVTQPLLVVPRRQDWGVVSPQGKADLYKLI